MIATMLLLWACSGSDPSDDSPGRPTSGTGLPYVFPTGLRPTGETGTAAVPGQIAIDVGDQTAAGGHLWVMAFVEHLPIEARLDGQLLTGRTSPSYPAVHVFDVPDDARVGLVDLELQSGRDGSTEIVEVTVNDPRFIDVAQVTGLADVHDVTGADEGCAQALTGIAWADLDNDGDFDALIGHYGASSRVLLNDGAPAGQLPTFTDVSADVGFDTVDRVGGLVVVDIDADGDSDLFVARRGTNLLLRNEFVPEGEVRFTDVTDAWGLAGDEQRTMGAVFGDPDRDGDLDVYEINHTWCFPGQSPDPSDNRYEDHFYVQEDGRFVRRDDLVPDQLGARTGREGFVGMWLDHERDGDLDLFVVNDFVPGGGPSTLLRNDAPESLLFTDISDASNFGLHPDPAFKGVNGMGLSVGDLNHDGFPDFAVSNIGPNLVMMSTNGVSGRAYENQSEALATHRPLLPWGVQSVTWATQMFDHDNDGDLELFYVGGNIRGGELVPHAFFDNEGGTFRDIGFAAGLSHPGHGKASALVDLDQDGYLDLTVANWAGPLEVYRNRSGQLFPGRHWVAIDLVGNGVETHPDAMGSIVELTTDDGFTQTCFRSPRPSLSGSGDPACHFGLGERDTISSLQVTWPDGTLQDVTPPPVDARHVIADPR